MTTPSGEVLFIKFFSRTGNLLGNGVPLAKAVESFIREHCSEALFREMFLALILALKQGQSLSEALSSFAIFPATLIELVEQGERGGVLDTRMLTIADQLSNGVLTITIPEGDFVSPVKCFLEQREAEITTLGEKILSDAHRLKVSDIHVEPLKGGGRIRYRLNGVLTTQPIELDQAQHRALIAWLKGKAGLDCGEKRLPQEGQIQLQPPSERGGGATLDIRLASAPYYHGEKVVLRCLYPAAFPERLEQIMDYRCAEVLTRWISRPYGLILVSGPTGSGKTTTLMLLLKLLTQHESLNVVSVEDPVELVVPGMNQLPVNQTIGLTFVNALRTLLKQDPDVVSAGEIRDPETANLLARIAQTGHLVLTQLHTINPVESIQLMREIAVPRFLLRQILIGVVSQRLVRKLCPHCKKEDDREIAASVMQAIDLKKVSLYQAHGCANCHNTGYSGRLAIYEVFEPQEVFWIALEHKSPPEVLQKHVEAQKLSFKILARESLVKGYTSIDEIVRVFPEIVTGR